MAPGSKQAGERGRPAYFVGPWDLNRDLACLPATPGDGTVVLVESRAKGSALPYHRQKLVLVLSALHHFADELAAAGHEVEIINAETYVEGLRVHVREHRSEKIVALAPREWGLYRSLAAADRSGELGAPLELHDDGGQGGHFLLTRDEFADWADGRKALRMHEFYAFMRKRSGWLMERGKPLGGRWSFDTKNRKFPRDEPVPDVPRHRPDALTRAQIERVAAWPGHWGDLSAETFGWPVTRRQALAELRDFFAHRADGFGPYQDAMLTDAPWLWHLRLSAALNLSLLHPQEVCERIVAEQAAGRMPLASAEGLLRQVLGWREFMRGIYWLKMPELRARNRLGAERALPAFFWDPSLTDMHCMQQCVGQVRATGYAHHIQRLMVLGNFALLAGIEPIEISHWFWAAFVDAYEWVELPNVHGMAVFADDSFTTKPYAASASYINKMSDYCAGCRYDPKRRTGDSACPFNALYWAFMHRHRGVLEDNPRLGVLYRTWDRWDDAQRTAILDQAEAFLGAMPAAEHEWTFSDDRG